MFLGKICLSLGRSPMEMSSAEFLFWQSFFAVEPLPDDRADLRMQRQVWASLQPHSKKRLDESKYAFVFGSPKRLTPAQYKAKSMLAYRGHGGKSAQGKKTNANATYKT